MASFWEPPALLSVATMVGVTGAALYYGLRPALRRPLPVVTSERDEVWGTDDPPPLPKRPYVYPADLVVPVDEDEEPSLTDLFRARRPARPAPPTPAPESPTDATPQD